MFYWGGVDCSCKSYRPIVANVRAIPEQIGLEHVDK